MLHVQGLTTIKSLLCLSVPFKWRCQTKLAPASISLSPLHLHPGFLMTCSFLRSWWSSLARKEDYHSYFITGDSVSFWKHCLADHCKLSGYCELWNSFLLLPADKMHFLEANRNVKSSPDFIWNVRWELRANWHRRALTRTVAVNASFWVWFFWFWRSELNTGETCQRIWWVWLQRLLQRTWIPEITCGIFVWQHQ